MLTHKITKFKMNGNYGRCKSCYSRLHDNAKCKICGWKEEGEQKNSTKREIKETHIISLNRLEEEKNNEESNKVSAIVAKNNQTKNVSSESTDSDIYYRPKIFYDPKKSEKDWKRDYSNHEQNRGYYYRYDTKEKVSEENNNSLYLEIFGVAFAFFFFVFFLTRTLCSSNRGLINQRIRKNKLLWRKIKKRKKWLM